MNKLLQLILVILIMSTETFASSFSNAINAVFDEATNYFTFSGSFDSGSNTITLSRVTRKQTSYSNGEAFPLVIPGSKTVTSNGTDVTYTIVLKDNQGNNGGPCMFYFDDINYPVDLTLSDIEALRSCVNMFRIPNSNSNPGLIKLTLSNFDTNNVAYMSNMFWGCNSLTELDLSCFKTGNVTHMGHMFADCSSLKELDLSSFDTSKTMFIDYMFTGCGSLTELDLSNFRTSNAEWIQGMFEGCSSLTELDLSSFDTSKAAYMEYMFAGCSSLTELDLSSFRTNNVTTMQNMFDGCSSLTKLDISSFDTGKVTDISNMFKGCTGLKLLVVKSDFPANSNITDEAMADMFAECTAADGKIMIRSPDGKFNQRFEDFIKNSSYGDIVTFSHLPLDLSFKLESDGVLVFAGNANRNSNVFFDNETGITLENNSTVKNATVFSCPTTAGERAYFELASGATSAAIKNIFAVQHDDNLDESENTYGIKRGTITGNYVCITECGDETTDISVENDNEVCLENLAELTENDTVVFAIHDGESLEQNTVVIKNEEDGPAEIAAKLSNDVNKDGYTATDVTFQGNLKFSGNQSGFVNGKATASGADIEFVGNKSMFQVPLELTNNSKVKISEFLNHERDITVDKGSQLEIRKDVTLSGGTFRFGC